MTVSWVGLQCVIMGFLFSFNSFKYSAIGNKFEINVKFVKVLLVWWPSCYAASKMLHVKFVFDRPVGFDSEEKMFENVDGRAIYILVCYMTAENPVS